MVKVRMSWQERIRDTVRRLFRPQTALFRPPPTPRPMQGGLNTSSSRLEKSNRLRQLKQHGIGSGYGNGNRPR